jgi:hypothetical protein
MLLLRTITCKLSKNDTKPNCLKYIFVVECSIFCLRVRIQAWIWIRLKGMRIDLRLDLDPFKRNRDLQLWPENSELDANVPYPGRMGRLHIL